MSRHFQLALRGTITWRPRRRTQTTKTSTWSCGSSPHALTDSPRFVHDCAWIRSAAKDAAVVNDSMPSSVPVLTENETWIVAFHMEMYVPLLPYDIKHRHIQLCVYFPLANLFFIFLVSVHIAVTQAGSCSAALQCAPSPTSKQCHSVWQLAGSLRGRV